MQMRRIDLGIALVLFTTLLVSQPLNAEATASNGWRGAQRTGAISKFEIPKVWPQALKKKWDLDVGSGHSSPVVVGERIYQFSRQGKTKFSAVSASMAKKSGDKDTRRHTK